MRRKVLGIPERKEKCGVPAGRCALPDNRARIVHVRSRSDQQSGIMECSEQIQHVIQIDFLPDAQVVFRLCQIIKQKFQDQGAAQTAAFDFEM